MPDVSLTVISNGQDADATPVNNNFQALQAAVNALDADNWASGKIFAPSKLTQESAATDEALIWNGSSWVHGTYKPSKLQQEAAGLGQALMWNGSAWAPTTVAQLLGSVSYDPTTVTSPNTTSTTGADIDATNLSLAVTVPASGKILVAFSFCCTGGHSALFMGLRESTNNIGYGKLGFSSPTDNARFMMQVLITGLSAGAHTYKAAFKAVSGTVTLSYGTQASPATTDQGPFVMAIYGVP